MDVFTRRASTSSWFACLVTTFISENLKEEFKVAAQSQDPFDSPFRFLQADISPSKSLGDKIFCKHEKNKHIERVGPDYWLIESKERKDYKQQRRNLSASSESFIAVPRTL